MLSVRHSSEVISAGDVPRFSSNGEDNRVGVSLSLSLSPYLLSQRKPRFRVVDGLDSGQKKEMIQPGRHLGGDEGKRNTRLRAHRTGCDRPPRNACSYASLAPRGGQVTKVRRRSENCRLHQTSPVLYKIEGLPPIRYLCWPRNPHAARYARPLSPFSKRRWFGETLPYQQRQLREMLDAHRTTAAVDSCGQGYPGKWPKNKGPGREPSTQRGVICYI